MPPELDRLRKILADIPGWRLPESDWESVARLLTDADDPDEIPAVCIELRLLSPDRLSLPDEEPMVPAPPVVRERVARLIQRLGDPA